MLMRELKRRSNRFVAPGLALCLVAYFTYHLIHGHRGLISWQILETQLSQAHMRLDALQTQEKELENRVSLLRPDSICSDLLTERAKEVLGYAHPHEMVVREPSLP